MLYVALNMALCSVLFFAWAKPRETISGLLGRWKVEGEAWQRIVAIVLAAFVDRLYFWEPDHCVEVFKCEADARKVLYP